MGSFVIVTMEGENPEEAFVKMAQGEDEFTKYFVAQVKNCHGFDMSQPMPGPMPHLIIDSEKMGELAAV